MENDLLQSKSEQQETGFVGGYGSEEENRADRIYIWFYRLIKWTLPLTILAVVLLYGAELFYALAFVILPFILLAAAALPLTIVVMFLSLIVFVIAIVYFLKTSLRGHQARKVLIITAVQLSLFLILLIKLSIIFRGAAFF